MAHIPHTPAALLSPHQTTTTPCLNMKKPSSLSSKPFLSQHPRAGGPSLRSILVLTALTLYGLQSFLSHFSTLNATTPRRSSYFSPTSSSSSSTSSRTTFGVPFPTPQSTHQRSRSRGRKQQQHTYSPQERQHYQQTWHNDNDNAQEPLDHRTAFEKKYFSDTSYFPSSNDDFYDYDNTGTSHTQSDDDTFSAFDEHEARQVLPGSECKGYYCADTDTCVDRPINCPCPHVLDTKCFRSDWFVCFRGPHQC